MKKIFAILSLFISILLPLLLVLSGIRLALTPAFVRLQYNLPGFPADPFGFSKMERLQWAEDSLDYLLGKMSQANFSALQTTDGQPLYNQRELQHMLDVRLLTLAALKVWRALMAGIILVCILMWVTGYQKQLWQALRCGARFTLLLIALIIFGILLNFDALFTTFHRIFFEGDSWLFRMDDTLIRLFPIFFWQVVFVFIGSISGVIAIILLYVSQKQLRKN